MLIIIGSASQTVLLFSHYLQGATIITGIERTLFFFAWFISVAFIAYVIRLKVYILGAFLAPLLFLLTIPSVIIPQGMIEQNPTIMNPWLLSHVSLVFASEAIFTVAFIAGMLYVFQEKRLKSKKVGSFLMKLPSLTTLDKLNHLCLLIGFPLLTLGLALGILYSKQLLGVFWKWDYKEVWALVTWILFASLIYARLAAGWKGKKAALGSILGFLVIIITLFVVSYFPHS